MLTIPLTFDSEGYLSQNGKRFIPIGVNYWPGSCGTEMWSAWPEAEMRRDLGLMVKLGLNSLRFFLRWDAFEPEDGQWNELSLARLVDFVGWCRDAGIYAQPTLFVGWMSGATYWPEWKAGRNLFADADLRIKSARYARKIAEVCRPFHAAIMGFDLGNELCCLSESREAAPREVVAWCAAVTGAIHEAFPESWSMSGCEQNHVTSDTGWHLDDQPGTSCLSMHTYPVPGWHPVPVDGFTDPLTRSLLPFYVKVARAFGPVMVQEFGTILTRSPELQRDYLAEVLPKCWQAGANGFLWWCWCDFTCSHHPYNKSTFEKDLGLVDRHGNLKPGAHQFLEFGRKLQASPPAPSAPAKVALYWPKHYYHRDNQANPGNNPGSCAPRLILAHYLLERAGYPVAILRHDAVEKSHTKIIVIAGTLLVEEEIISLRAWVEKGGLLLWHGPNPHSMGEAFQLLAGFTAIDLRQPRSFSLKAVGEEWKLNRFPHGTRVDTELCGAQVIHAAGDTPLVFKNQVGHGRVITALPDVEGCALDDAAQSERRDHWAQWYRGMIENHLKAG